MAKKSRKTTTKRRSNKNSKQEKFRIILGVFFLFLGAYLILSIGSYFFTWKQDSSVISNETIFNFLFNNNEHVENFTGRLGAAAAHILVKETMGISSLVFSFILLLTGLKILNSKSLFQLGKWIRILSFCLLFVAPLLYFIFQNHEFSFGGAIGKSIVDLTNTFVGKPGTIITLLLILTIFGLLIFNWDIKPWLLKMKNAIPKKPNFIKKEAIKEKINNFKKQVSTSPTDKKLDIEDQASKEHQEVETNTPTTNEDELEDTTDGIELIDNDKLDQETPIEIDTQIDVIEATEVALKPIQNSEDTSSKDKISKSTQKEVPSSKEVKDGIFIELPEEPAEDFDKTESSKIIAPSEEVSSDNKEPIVLNKNLPEDFKAHTQSDGFVIQKAKEDEVIEISGKSSVGSIDTDYSPELDLRDFKFPILDLLEPKGIERIALNEEELKNNKNQIVHTLESFGIKIKNIQATVGPTVTLYEIIPEDGVRISKIRNLEDDIALNLAALGIRMIAPIPGKGTIGIEVPNEKKQIVPIRALLSSKKFIDSDMSLPIALGKKIDNENHIVDLAKMPHLLVAGATGQGKSVGINAIIVSLLYKKHPSQLKFVLIDPKKVELSVYRAIEKHYLAKLPNEDEAIITDTKKVINTLNSLCIEMENRYELLKDAGARNIKEYNQKFTKRKLNPQNGHKFLPFIVLVIDEFADLIMTAGKEIEQPVARLAQLARAVGIHLIVATQRPSVNVITGIIKANFPARVAFRVTSKVDSRTILDTGGADQLIGKGDMLVSYNSELLRIQCAFVDTPEVERIVEFIGEQRGYPNTFELPEYEGAEEDTVKKDVDLSKRDKLFEDCARLVVNSQSGSTSMLQRKFNLGYNRAGRIMDQLEASGIVGGQVGSKPREVLVSTEYELDNILTDL